MLLKARKQLTLFFYGLSYFTRIPIPRSVDFDNDQFYKANAYLPIIGLIVAVVMIVVFYLSQLIFSTSISLILMLMASLLLTGALHEDGFADCCDGFGGGYDITQRLKIMKDSQIGTYGGIGLIFLFLFKFSILIELAEFGIVTLVIGLLVAHSLSRYIALTIMQALDYVRLENGGKVQGLAKKLNRTYFVFASVCASLPLFLLPITTLLSVFFTVGLVSWLLFRMFRVNIEGYTGDCLGFAQQIVELSILLLLTTGISV
ncbi:MAG: adenosylcobinamide-GDP ribazoletransferase [Psychromonas sp.]|nr:adenosylcobinamide-GDP ribazoletransferase [Psychromonas sp.]